LVHHDDVAAAIALAVTTTSAPPGAYNIAGDGVLSLSDIADALGGRPVKVPQAAAVVTSEVLSRLPFVPSALEWLHAGRTSAVMDISKAKSQLQWTPKYSASDTLSALADTVG
jgi:nucleoside-diphosphate-sugar epimerase